MAIESAAYFRRLLCSGCVVLLGLLSSRDVAMAQKELVSTASVVQLPITGVPTPCQIYKIINAPNGDTLFMDVCGGGGYGSIYRLKAGTTTFDSIAATIDTGGTYWNEDMAMDAKGDLYITDRYGSAHIYRVPYNPSDSTHWDFSAASDVWESTLAGGAGTQNVAFLDSPAKDGSGTLFVSLQSSNSIIMVPVNADGTVPTFPSGSSSGQPEYQTLVATLKDKVQPMAVDVNGNLYFIENPYDSPSARATGVFFIPETAYQSCLAAMAAGTSTPGTPCISGTEASLARIDPGNTEKFNGLTLDSAGNVYVTDASDGYGGTRNGLLMIPNESGSPVGVTAASFNFEDAIYLTPSPGNANPTIDPRGFIWMPTGTASNWSPNGSGAIPGTGNLVLWAPGTANLGATPIGTPGTANAVFFTFSGSVTPSDIVLSQPGSSADFISAANPYPADAGTTPAVPCTAGKTYIAFSYCEYWVALNPSGTNSVGSVQGQLSMLDASSNVVPGSTAYLNGIGEGPAVSLLVPAMQTPLATTLVSPQQVAGDSQGNSYVADSGQGKVLVFPAGSTTPTAGSFLGTGLTAPTGVAVDGSGDVYIADSGKVIEIPSVGGVLNTAGQTVLQSGLGANVQLAADGAGNVYAADPSNGRVVRIYNPQMAMLIPAGATIGTGFTAPSAVAVDNSGDVFVADGANLVEINSWGGQTTITSNLSTPVTGLAVDPSGSVYVAQSGGVIRIPMESGTLSFNDAVAIDSDGVTAPKGIGIDALGDLYVTVNSYNTSTLGSSGAGTSPVNTPNVLLLDNAFVNFGIVSQQTQSNPIDVNVYNIGNEPLAFTADPVFSGTNGSDYSIQADGQNPCDTSGGTTVASASACQLGVTVTAQGLALSQGTMAVATNAVNAPTTTATLEAYSSDLLCKTVTTISLSPSSGLGYPGSTTVTSSTVADPNSPCTQGGSPQGGTIALTLQPQSKGASPSTQTGQLPSDGQYTFNLSNLNGGTYVLYVSYRGDAVYGGSSSARTFTINVAQAPPTVTLSEPSGNAVNGTYYVRQGATTTLPVTVTSPLGKPTGTVTFMNGSTVLGTATLDASGQASFNTASLPAGPNPAQLGQTYNITAVYNGDINFASVTSTVAGVVVVPSSGVALITANPPSITTPAGTPASTTLTIAALQGYSPLHNIQLYCASPTLPKYAECTFDVPQPDLYSATQNAKPGTVPVVTTKVTISSNLAITLSERRTDSSPVFFAGMFGLGLLGLAFGRKGRLHRSKLKMVCLMLVFAGAVAGFTGCTNSGYTHTPPAPKNTTPSGTYNVSIYAIDLQTLQQTSLPFTLTVTIQ